MNSKYLIRVKNLERYHHYKDRNPPWIKLHQELLEDYDFACLPDSSKAHYLCLLLLASRLDNLIPDDPAWIRTRIGARENVDIELLVTEGFLERVAGESIENLRIDGASRYARESRPGFVYVMTCGGIFKIGLSAKPHKRRSQVAQDRGRPVDLLLTIPVGDMREVESFYHERYASVRLDGEWFALEPWMLAELRAAAAGALPGGCR